MLKAIIALLIHLFPWLSADHRRRIRPRQKCPACGAIRKHRMNYDTEQRLVVLTCLDCAAAWGFEPLIKPTRWTKSPQE